MKLGEFLKIIGNLKVRGEITDDTELVYSSDDEGNNFDEVCFGPTAGKFYGSLFLAPKDMEQLEKAGLMDDEATAVKERGKTVLCLN